MIWKYFDVHFRLDDKTSLLTVNKILKPELYTNKRRERDIKIFVVNVKCAG